MAQKEADFHNKDIFRKNGELAPYRCTIHRGWHNGHSQELTNPVARIHQILDKKNNEKPNNY